MSNPSDSRRSTQPEYPGRAVLRQQHPVSADQRLSRQADRDRGDRWRRQDDADSTAARMARGARLRRRRDRLDPVAADAADHRARQVEQHPQQAHLRAALRDRLRRSAREGNHPGAEGGLHRALGPVYLHRAGARRRARHRSRLAARAVRLRDCAAHGLLPEGRRKNADRPDSRISRHGFLGVRDGHEVGRRHLRQLPAYQNKLLREYASMADEFHFRTLDARRSIDHIQDELRKQVAAFLEPADKPAETLAR